jgi:adenosylcobinamide-GDP ribazoletransferase
MKRGLDLFWQEIWMAVGFLTTLPTPAAAYDQAQFGRSGRWFPVVGLAIGLLLVAADLVLRRLFPDTVRGVLIVAGWAALTGGLHLDGLADCCDALPAAVSRERRLEILRDPRLGAFGGIGLILFLLLKSSAVSALAPPYAAVTALLLAPVWARWFLLLAARRQPARPDGMGAAFASGLAYGVMLAALIVPVATLIVSGLMTDSMARSLAAVAAAWGVAWLCMRVASARLGGVTGDVYGLVVELSELTILLCYLL